MSETRNRLFPEKSPYLLQHSGNPVDWYPWGEQAFEKAVKENKPVFLSIGYSTCHWCHVMAHESFEDAEVARLMNETFVSIKVDREERPDIDGVYMTVCQMMTGSGGWPLTIVMTPERKPFFAATYIPKESRYGRMGMLELVPTLARVWTEKKDEIKRVSEEAVAAVRDQQRVSAGSLAERSARDPRRHCFDKRPQGPIQELRRAVRGLRERTEVSHRFSPPLPPQVLEKDG